MAGAESGGWEEEGRPGEKYDKRGRRQIIPDSVGHIKNFVFSKSNGKPLK